MDKETIQQIAAEVVHRLPYGDRRWLFLLINVLLIAGAAAVAAAVGAYLKIKGENFATQQDFEKLQEQLGANTKLVEEIKSEVSQRDWAQREWTNLRRGKLEALLTKMHECEAYLDQYIYYCKDHTLTKAAPRDPSGELTTIVDLYLPELQDEISSFTAPF